MKQDLRRINELDETRKILIFNDLYKIEKLLALYRELNFGQWLKK